MELKTTLEMVVSTWTRPIADLHVSPTEFYAKLGEELGKLEIPDAKISRKWWKESRLISAKREYLRIERDRCVFDICCAPFGRGTFISSWQCIVPFCLSFTHIIGMLVLGMLGAAIVGPQYADAVSKGYVGLGRGYRDFAAGLMGFTALFSILLHTPLWWFICKRRDSFLFINSNVISDLICGMTIIGPVLLMWAQGRPTYYQLDSAAVFQGAVHDATMDVLEEYMKAQNLRVLTEDERAPVMREFLRERLRR